MNYCPSLTLHNTSVSPGTEWSPEQPGLALCRTVDGGYLLGRNLARELSPGAVVLVANATGVRFRASQLQAMGLQHFHIRPEMLSGVLTLSEQRVLEGIAAHIEKAPRFFEATHPLTPAFAELCAQPKPVNELVARALLLRLAGLSFGTEFQAGAMTVPETDDSRRRFLTLLQRMSEAELHGHSLSELAVMCGCSERHFSRLFQGHFGINLRAKQIAFRLERAKQLLRESNSKVIHVALESGFKHVGHFNMMFKREFGSTPSEWRQRATKPKSRAHRNGVLIALAFSLCSRSEASGADAVVGVTNSVTTKVAAGNAVTTNSVPNNGVSTNFVATTNSVTPSALTPVSGVSTNIPALLSTLRPTGTVTNAATEVYTTNAPPKPTFKVDRYEVNGNTLLTPLELEGILTNFVGPKISVEQVVPAQKTLNLAYRRKGYVTVSTTLPPQKITNGVVQLKVIEGRLAEITVTGNRYFSSNNVMRALPSLRTNEMLQVQWFNPELDRANRNSDRQVYPEIIPGPEPGTSALMLKVKDRIPLHGRLEVNNQSTPGTPDMRVNTSVQYNNLWQYEHSLGAQYSFSPERMKEQNRLPERFYDHPLIANYSAYYRMPLTSQGSYRAQATANPAAFGYDEATKQFRLPASTGNPELSLFASRSTTDTGTKKGPVTNVSQTSFLKIDSYDTGQDLSQNESLGWRVSLPLPDVGGVKTTLSAGMDFKVYNSASYNTNNFPYTITVFDAFGVPSEKTTLISAPQPFRSSSLTYLPATLRWESSVSDKRGQYSFFTGVNANLPVLSSSADFKGVAGSQLARNDYLTAVIGVSREQRLPGGYSILLRADGQWANMPLISNEQFGIAGTGAVRGYQDGEQFGDTGWKVSLEPRTPFYELGMVDGTEPMRVRMSAFMDYGENYFLEPLRGNARKLWGTGLGIQALIGQLIDGRLAIGWALNETRLSAAGSVRASFAVGVQF